MKLRPPFAQDWSGDVQPGSDGRSHWVSQTRSVSGSGEKGAAVLRLASFIFTRRHALPAGWHAAGLGQLTDDETMSRFGIVELEEPSASYVASPVGSVTEFSWTGSPDGFFPLN